MDLRREIILLSRWTGWALETVEDLPIGEFWEWLESAAAVEAEVQGAS